MKRTALLFLLFMLFILPAFAELPEGYAPVTVIQQHDFLYALADGPDGERVFIGGIRSESGWQYAVSAPVPEGTVLFTEDDASGPHAVLGFHHPEAEGSPWVEHFIEPCGEWDMVLQEDGWHEVFLADASGMWHVTATFCGTEEIRYQSDHVWSDWEEPWYGIFSIPRDVEQADWLTLPLTFADALALMDSAGYEDENALWQPRLAHTHKAAPDLAGFVSAHLPGYTAWDGETSEQHAVLLADDAQGQRYFIAGQYTDGTWHFSVSQPLPEDTGIEVTICDESISAALYLPLPREKQRLYNGIRDIEVYAARQDDGSWRLNGINTGTEHLILERFGISDDTGVVCYGTLMIDTDPFTANWNALPSHWPSAMTCVDTSDWRIVSAAAADLRASPDGDSPLLGRYFAGAPMRILAEADGWLQVEVLGTGHTGWLAAEDTLPASEQLWYPWAADGSWHSMNIPENRYPLPEAILDPDESEILLSTAPHNDDAALLPMEWYEYLRLLGLCAEGCCYHVYHEDSGLSGWVAVTDMPRPYQEAAFISNHVPGYVPDYYYNAAYMGETTVIALVYEPDRHARNGGSMYFMGAVLTDGEWRVTLSTPFPAGLWPALDAFHAGEGTIAVSFMHPELLRESLSAGIEDADIWADRHYVIEWRDGAWKIVSTGGEMADSFFLDDHTLLDDTGFEWHGDFLFSRDVTQVNWLAFPTTLEKALEQTDSSRWSILRARESLRTAPQGESEILGEYLPGTWVRLLDSRDGWRHVAVNGGSVTGWMEADALAVPDSQPMISGLPMVKTGSRIVSVLGVAADGMTYHACAPADGWEAFLPAAECTPYLGEVYWRIWPDTERAVLQRAILNGWYFLDQCVSLLAEPAPDALSHGTCFPGTWAEVLETKDGWQRIRIHDAAEGWVPASSLTSARDLTLLPQLRTLKLRMGEPAVCLLDAPEGRILTEYDTDWPNTVTLLGDLDGWYLVHDGLQAGYLRKTDCEGYQ